jgi:hypothetical protein
MRKSPRDRFVTGAVLAAALSAVNCAAAHPTQSPDSPTAGRAWEVITDPPRATAPACADLPADCAVVRLDKRVFDAVLREAPRETGSGAANGVVVALPMPDGTLARFRVVESSIVAPELAAAFPDIRTYSGQGIDDTTATTRFGWTGPAFHAVVLDSAGSVYIDPSMPGNTEYYVTLRKRSR